MSDKYALTNEHTAEPTSEPTSHLTLHTPGEFRFAEALVYLARSPQECLYRVHNHKVQKLLHLHGDLVLIEIGESDEGNLTVQILTHASVPVAPTTSTATCAPPSPSPSTQSAIAEYVSDWFDLSTHLQPFYELAQRDPILAPLVQNFHGLRVIGIPDLFEALCWAIIGQQINLAFAYTLKKRFVESYGEHLVYDGQTHWLFPTPEVVAKLSIEDLMPLQFSARKAEYVITVAQHMVSGALSKEKLLGLGDFREMESELVRIRGIGHWSANYALMRCLRDPSAFPIADVGLHNALKQQLQMDRKPSLEEIRTLARGWCGWEAYATFYLWRSLQS